MCMLFECVCTDLCVCKINGHGWQEEEGVWKNQWAVRVETPLPAAALTQADS